MSLPRGRNIFLRQLEWIRDAFVSLDWLSASKDVEEAARAFEVPGHLTGAFTAYCLDYLVESGQAVNEEGVFYDGEDLSGAVKRKFYAFYRPVVDLLEGDLMFMVYCDPSWEDVTTVLVVCEGAPGSEKVPFPVLALADHRKAWRPMFEDATAGCVYAELEDIYGLIRRNVDRALKGAVCVEGQGHSPAVP